MRILIVLGVVLALAIAGVIGFVVQHESERGKAAAAASATQGASDAAIAVISHGERVTIEQHVPQRGHAVVMFTADW